MATTFPPSPVSSFESLVLEKGENSPDSPEDSGSIFAQLRLARTSYLAQPESVDLGQQFLSARRAASEAIARFPQHDFQSPLVYDARHLVQGMACPEVNDMTTDGRDLARATDLTSKGWPGLLAAMLLTPAWQWRAAPLLHTVPEWMMADYVKWLFAAPQVALHVGGVEGYAKHVRSHLQDLVDWLQRNSGLAADLLAAITLNMDHSLALAASTEDLRAYAELRGVVAMRSRKKDAAGFCPLALPREGRRLCVGVVAEHFGAGPEMRLLLPLFGQLDNQRFEVKLFSGADEFSAVKASAGEDGAATIVLPAEEAARVDVLRAAGLDVLLFGTNLSARLNGVSRLALYRMAPLQLASPLSAHTSGLPQVDLFMAGEQTLDSLAPKQFTERLGLWAGPAQVVDRELGRQAPTQAWTKTSLGIAEDAVVFVSEAPHHCVTRDVIEVWAGLLAQVPGSQLILHPFGAGPVPANTAMRFGALVEGELRRRGVDVNRLLLSTLDLPNPGDVQALLSVGDIYLEAFAANSVEGLLRAFEAGLPVVACEGRTLRAGIGAAWLRTLGLESLIAKDGAVYAATALRLATDTAARTEAAGAVKKGLARLPLFSDSLAVSDAFGALMETAFDRLLADGAKAFAADRSPLRPATPVPTDRQGRWALGRHFLAAGRSDRAVDYLLAALANDEGTAELWLDVARALRANGQAPEAIQALEAGLRLDQTLIEGWRMLADLADRASSWDLAAQARQIVATLVAGSGASVAAPTTAQPKVESIVGKLRSLRIARRAVA